LQGPARRDEKSRRGKDGALGEIRTLDPQIRSLRSRLSAGFLMVENAGEFGVLSISPLPFVAACVIAGDC
jgi:hypothetical protein